MSAPPAFLSTARPPVRRALFALLALLALAAVAVGSLWLFSYGLSEDTAARATVAGLDAPVEISWNDAGVATVHAGSETARHAALGYVHGARRPWLATLWRQTATGRLGEWYGDALLPLDRLARRLGFADLAQRAYVDLPEEEQALLRAYARGMNASLQTRAVQNSGEFALLGEEPAPWEPWHTLAVERLYAYLAHSPPALDSLRQRGAPEGALRFLQADSTLRRWLHLHDLDRSAAWAARAEDGTMHLFYRHVYGSSAIPALQAVLFAGEGEAAAKSGAAAGGEAGTGGAEDDRRAGLAGEANVAALSLPGTPLLVAGRAGARAWALLPGGTLRVERAPFDTSAAPVRYERLLGADGREELVAFRRSGQGLLLSEAAGPDVPPAPDSLSPPAGARALGAAQPGQDAAADTAAAAAGPGAFWQVRWAGFAPATDLASWRALAAGTRDVPDFRLLRAGGLLADSSGSVEPFGTPARVVTFEDGLVAGPADWTPFLAEQIQMRLRQAARDSTSDALRPAQWMRADSSTWAGRLAPSMLASVDSLSRTQRGTFSYEERTDLFGQAIRYLRNWDYAYDGASIGASIFDTWVAAYRRETGHLPPMPEASAPSDSLRRLEDRRRFRLLGDAVSQLAREYGDEISAWRWETVAPDTRFFPGWTDSLAVRRLRTLADTRYAPLEVPGGGHPSTLRYGASPVSPGMPAPASYEAWISTDAWQTLYVRRRRFDTETPFGRYRAPRIAPDPLALRFSPARPPTATTTLVPPDSSSSTGPVRARF